MADLKIKLPEVELSSVDTLITVQGSQGKLGEIYLSKGTIEWWPSGSKVNGKKLTWPAFAKFFEKHGSDLKVTPKAKPAAAAKAKPKAAKPVKVVKAKAPTRAKK